MIFCCTKALFNPALHIFGKGIDQAAIGDLVIFNR